MQRAAKAVLAVTLIGICAAAAAGTVEPGRIEVTWTSVGPGGGGGHYFPSTSPADHKIMMFSCDMGGIYLSYDGAKTWRVLPGWVARKLSSYPAFDPENARKFFIICNRGLLLTEDKGATWRRVLGKEMGFRSKPYQGTGIQIDPGNPKTVIAGFSRFERRDGRVVYISRDGGENWRKIPEWPGDVSTDSVYFDLTTPKDARVLYAHSRSGVRRSSDWGKTWTSLKEGLPGGRISSFVAAWNKNRRSAFYVTVPGRNVDGKYVGGVYKSTDEGKSWSEASNGLYRGTRRGRRGIMQYNELTMGRENLDLVYVVSSGVAGEPGLDRSCWRTTDGGKNWTCQSYGPHAWKECNTEHEWMNLQIYGGWGWGGGPRYMRCCPTKPEIIFYCNGGNGFMSTNAAERWTPTYTDRVGDKLYRGRGCEVLTCYQVYVAPYDAKRRWIAYTDIGLFSSPNGGSSWEYAAAGTPWPNTCYELAFDPGVKGKLYGAWSSFHDLPHKKMLRRVVARSRGGVCVSDDHGINWKVAGTGQPRNRGTCTTVVVDPASPADARVLYAGYLNAGVYKSVDGGKTWAEANNGLPAPPRRNVWRLVRRPDGSLLCGVTANFPGNRHVAGGLFVSTDGARSWKELAKDQPFGWLAGIRVDPRDKDTFYVSCFEAPPASEPALGTETPWVKGDGNGGVYKTTDSGKTFTKILDRPYCWDVTLDPKKPDTIYGCTYVDGVYRSTDAGRTFRQLSPPPFLCTHRATVDPLDDGIIWVTTFGGGTWKGRFVPSDGGRRAR